MRQNQANLVSMKPVRMGRRWKDEYFVRIYLLARQGLSNTAIAESLGVSKDKTLTRWVRIHPAVKDALDKGRADREGVKMFDLKQYVYGRLPNKLRPIWDEICKVDSDESASKQDKYDRIYGLIEHRGKRAKQYLWVHALVQSNFNKNEANRKANVSSSTLQQWIHGDPGFLELTNNIMEMKKDMIEGCLLGLVAQGDTNATIFAAKSLLKDRGYSTEVNIKHEGKVNHLHLNMDKVLDQLSPKAKRELLLALEDQNTKALPPRQVQTEDSE